MSSLNESTAAIAETKSPCTHGRLFMSVCVYCKALVKSSPGYFRLPGGHYSITKAEYANIKRAKGEQLIRDRKLTLLLDLDNTVIESSERDFGCKSAEVFQITPGELFMIKRPYLNEFLQRVSKFYEIHVVTFGAEVYARKVVDIIDPTKLISRKILFREKIQASQFGKKFPMPEMGPHRLRVIVDDTREAWCKPFHENVLEVRPFIPFEKMNHGISYESAVFDTCLLDLAGKLENIHSKFFKQYDVNKKTRVVPIIEQYCCDPLKAALEFSERVNQILLSMRKQQSTQIQAKGNEKGAFEKPPSENLVNSL